MGANLIDPGGLGIEIFFFAYFLQFVGVRRQNNHHQSYLETFMPYEPVPLAVL